MTIVKRSEKDIMRLVPFADIAVNPVNTQGAMGKGIAYEFRQRHPQMYDVYRRHCDDGSLKVGMLQVFKDRNDPNMPYTLINMATKARWIEQNMVDEIKACLLALRNYLQSDPGLKYRTVVMPMLGLGEMNRDYDSALPLFREYLDDLPNIVMLSMRPDYFATPPRYLAIVGARCITDVALVEQTVDDALTRWGLRYSDFDAIVSGGASQGVDCIAAGVRKTDDSITTRRHTQPPIICYADWDRHGRIAGFLRNGLVVDISTHVVALRIHPDCRTAKSPGTSDTVKKVKQWNSEHPNEQKLLYDVFAEPSK